MIDPMEAGRFMKDNVADKECLEKDANHVSLIKNPHTTT